ncbi:cytochrome P450 family protein [Actinokineospora diospyrosa]|uniref:Cytochrome P450 n=1 Tax=Actinokineospora diospyrosa TaxID=103728 RepID=A0ABT1IL35_9PSEU|nr:cytochrome P450 [Actinokineospora diospyrosa]MCP2272926.1 Cytochrome P450 [Actinokineospora diospyrosa]
MTVEDEAVRIGADFFQDPHRLYSELRRTGPVRRVVLPRGVLGWLVTRHADAKAVLSDPRLSKDFVRAGELLERNREPGSPRPEFGEELQAHMLNMDPPDHTRLRKLVNKAFTVRGVGHLRPRVEQITESLLEAIAEADEVDLIPALAFPVPMTVICELLGVPAADREAFGGWTRVLLSTSASTVEITEAGVAVGAYVMELIESKRSAPAEDLLTALVEAREDGDRLSENELLSMTFLLLLAGHETTVNLIANGVLSLLRAPAQAAALRANPALLPRAVEEFLRFESPVNTATMRYTTEPVVVAGVEIPADEFVVVAIGSANRDAAAFPDPDTVDIERELNAHLAFGHGIHYCVGAPLARMEAEVAIGGLLARFPDLALTGTPLQWRESTIIRGLHSLPVRLGRTPAQ